MGREEGGRGHSFSSSYALSLTHAHTCARLHPVAYPRPLPLTNLTHTIHALGHSLALSPPSLSHSLTRLLPHSLAQTRHSLDHASPRATSPHSLTYSLTSSASPLPPSLTHCPTHAPSHSRTPTCALTHALAHPHTPTYSLTHSRTHTRNHLPHMTSPDLPTYSRSPPAWLSHPFT